MNRFWTKKMLALMISVSLLAGSALPVFAAEQGTDAEAGDQDGYVTEQLTDAAGEQEPAAESDVIADTDADADAASEEETVIDARTEPETVYEETAAPEEITATEAGAADESGTDHT